MTARAVSNFVGENLKPGSLVPLAVIRQVHQYKISFSARVCETHPHQESEVRPDFWQLLTIFA
jgi:hypothetical protein